jgi:hypothetical protein
MPYLQVCTKPYQWPYHHKEYTHLSLLKIADAQFASSFIMIKRYREVRTALRSMVISKYWSFWRNHDINASKKVKDIVLDDGWWEREILSLRSWILSFLCCTL